MGLRFTGIDYMLSLSSRIAEPIDIGAFPLAVSQLSSNRTYPANRGEEQPGACKDDSKHTGEDRQAQSNDRAQYTCQDGGYWPNALRQELHTGVDTA